MSNLKVEVLTDLISHTAFRVSVLVRRDYKDFWKNQKSWPENTKVKIWNGNADDAIPLETTREFTRKIFIG